MNVVTQLGFKINENISSMGLILAELFKDIPTCNLADVIGRFRMTNIGIKSLEYVTIADQAETVQYRPRDIFMVYKALKFSRFGDIIIGVLVGVVELEDVEKEIQIKAENHTENEKWRIIKIENGVIFNKEFDEIVSKKGSI